MFLRSALVSVVYLALSVSGQAGSPADPQNSLTLDPNVLSKGFTNNGQQPPVDGQSPSLVSPNNFINFCLTTNLPLTDGKQVETGSCNTAPIGMIPSTANMPASKFAFPPNFGTVKEKETFDIQLNIARIQTGNFVNAQNNYFAAPQQLNAQGQIIGHTHVVIEQIDSFQSTAVPNPHANFVFFKGVNQADTNGVLSVTVPGGVNITGGATASFFRLCSINAAANHQPVILPIAQHGNSDDCIYFAATADGAPVADQTGGAGTGGTNNSGAGGTAGGTGTDNGAGAGTGGAGTGGAGTGGAGTGSGNTGNTGGNTGGAGTGNTGSGPAPGTPGSAPRPGEPGAAPRPGEPGSGIGGRGLVHKRGKRVFGSRRGLSRL